MVTKRKRVGRPRMSGKGKGRSPFIGVRFGEDLLGRIDRYRKAQDEMPGRSEVLRQLVEAGLKAKGF